MSRKLLARVTSLVEWPLAQVAFRTDAEEFQAALAGAASPGAKRRERRSGKTREARRRLSLTHEVNDFLSDARQHEV
jgi:hypothetical protein